MTTPITPSVPFDPTKFDAAAKTLQLRKIREKMKEIKDRHTEELADFVAFEAKLMGEFISFLRATKQLNCKNVNGTPYLTLKTSYSVENPDEYRRHVIGTESWDMLSWGITKTSADTFRLQHGGKMQGTWLIGGDLPPGVKVNQELTLGVLGPAKPKTKSDPSPAPSTGSGGNAGPVVEEDEEVEAL